MRHHNANKKFGRVRKGRTALLRSLARSLVLKERIHTTHTRAKALRPFIEKLVTKGREGTLSARRTIVSRLGGASERETKKIIDTIAPRYKERTGGYTRITKVSPRKGDGSDRAIIEFI